MPLRRLRHSLHTGSRYERVDLGPRHMPTHHGLMLRKKEGPANIVGIDVLGSRHLNGFSVVDKEASLDQAPDSVAIKQRHLESVSFSELTSANPEFLDS